MLTFKDLEIKTNNEQIEKFIDALTLLLSKNPIWSREKDKENEAHWGEKTFVFRRQKDDKLPSVGLCLCQKENGLSWYVPNVVPLESSELSYKEYNDILTEFYEQLVKPSSNELRIETEITSGEVNDVDILGKEAARFLLSFSHCANKSTGGAHPADRKRWFAFIHNACISNKQIDIDLLARLLIEQGWNEDRTNKLVAEFEFGRDLIKYMKANG